MSNAASPQTKKDKHRDDIGGVDATTLRNRLHRSNSQLSTDSTATVDSHLIEILRRNYNIVKILSDYDIDDSSSSASSSRRNSENQIVLSRSLKKSPVDGDELTLSDLSYRQRLKCCSNGDDLRYRNAVEVQTVEVSPEHEKNSAASAVAKMRARMAAFYVDLLDDLSMTNEDLPEENAPPKHLSAHALRRDAKRCLSESHPYMEMMAGFRDIFIWKAPLSSLMLFFMFLNYLSTQRNIDVGLNLLPKGNVPVPTLDLSGIQLIFDIAKYCQMMLEIAADVMEKVKHLFLWTRPKVSGTVFVLILLAFLLSLFISMRTYFTFIGLGLGIHAFVLIYLFHRFPRLQHKLDPAVVLLDRLPTDKDVKLEMKGLKLSPDEVEKIEISGDESLMSSKDDFELVTEKDAVLKDVNVQRTARSCILMDKEKSFPHSMSAGTLVLTDASLLFTYNKLRKGKQEKCEIPIYQIKSIKKTHTMKLLHLPGGGHALKVYVENRKSAYHFVHLTNRDDLYEELIKCAEAAGHSVLTHEKSE